jgi:hypothetical protein
MYTGTLIKDLMATVERAERGAFSKAHRRRNGTAADVRVAGFRSRRNEPVRRSGINGNGSGGNSGCGSGSAAEYLLYRNAGDLLRQGDRQFASGEGGRPGRNREMKQFGTALACLFLLVFTYAWQHFRAIEYGYQIESAKRELNNLTEMNRALRLEDASAARSGTNRRDGAPHGIGAAGTGAGDPHG